MAVRLLAYGHALLSTHIHSASGTRFSYRLSKPHGLVRLELLGKLIKFIRLIGSPSRPVA
jgi:hypothetical protein